MFACISRHQPGQTLQPVPPPQNGVHGPTATGEYKHMRRSVCSLIDMQ